MVCINDFKAISLFLVKQYGNKIMKIIKFYNIAIESVS